MQSTQELSLDELGGVCALLKIPYIVIVQPHLLKDKGSVRLRRVVFDSLSSASSGGNESFVPLDHLAVTILSSAPGTREDHESTSMSSFFDQEPSLAPSYLRDNISSSVATGTGSTASSSKVLCIFVDTDQYYGLDSKQVNKSDTSNYKSIIKNIKSVTQRSESYLDSFLTDKSAAHATPVIAVPLNFWILRDFGSCVMKQGQDGSAGVYAASAELTERHPKHKKVLKTLAMAIDGVMKKNGFWIGKDTNSSNELLTLFLYSKADDRFDMISLPQKKGTSVLSSDVRSGRHHHKADRR